MRRRRKRASEEETSSFAPSTAGEGEGGQPGAPASFYDADGEVEVEEQIDAALSEALGTTQDDGPYLASRPFTWPAAPAGAVSDQAGLHGTARPRAAGEQYLAAAIEAAAELEPELVEQAAPEREAVVGPEALPGPGDEPEVDGGPAVEVEAEIYVEFELEAESEVEEELEVDLEAGFEVEPEAEIEVEPEAEIEVEPEARIEAEPEARIEAEPEAGLRAEGEFEVHQQPPPPPLRAEAEPEPAPAAMAGAVLEPSSALVPLAGTEPEVAALMNEHLRRSDVDSWGRSEKTRALSRRLTGFYYRTWFRVEWDGLENVPKTGGALLVSNHAGAIPADAPMIMHGIEEELKRPVYGLADHWFRTIPVVGTGWSRSGGVPAHPDNAYRLLRDEQQLVLVFPEGTKATSKLYKDRYRLRRFGRGGFVETAMRAGVPIVPIAVVGGEEAMPILTRLPSGLAKAAGVPYLPITLNHLLLGPVLGTFVWLPAKFHIRVLEPVRFDVDPDKERYPRGRVMEEADAIRVRLQEALYDMLRGRRSPWLG
jgi:1-acyl-sn-glycerol-3-phosphate acyltransferase